MRFLHGTSKPTIAILTQDARESRHVKTYEINLRDKEFQEGPFNLPNVEGGASILITVPQPLGGVVVIGEQTIIYHNGQSLKSLIMKPTVMKTWGRIDANFSRILLGDHSGRLWILQLVNDGTNVTDMKLELIGETVTASCIRYIDNAVVFVGSRYGDSQLLRLLTEPNPEYGDQYLEIIQNFTNIGPIVDFTVVDLDRQGQGQIVTCSGAYKDGSLRIVRNGIGIDEHAVVDLPGIKGVFSLTPPEGSEFQKYLVITFVGEVRFHRLPTEVSYELGLTNNLV
jgi:DNA damage-binding protein 1